MNNEDTYVILILLKTPQLELSSQYFREVESHNELTDSWVEEIFFFNPMQKNLILYLDTFCTQITTETSFRGLLDRTKIIHDPAFFFF